MNIRQRSLTSKELTTLLLACWIFLIDVLMVKVCLQAIRTGVLRGKRGYKTYRTQNPVRFWLGITLLIFGIVVTFYLGCLMVVGALTSV